MKNLNLLEGFLKSDMVKADKKTLVSFYEMISNTWSGKENFSDLTCAEMVAKICLFIINKEV